MPPCACPSLNCLLTLSTVIAGITELDRSYDVREIAFDMAEVRRASDQNQNGRSDRHPERRGVEWNRGRHRCPEGLDDSGQRVQRDQPSELAWYCRRRINDRRQEQPDLNHERDRMLDVTVLHV